MDKEFINYCKKIKHNIGRAIDKNSSTDDKISAMGSVLFTSLEGAVYLGVKATNEVESILSERSKKIQNSSNNMYTTNNNSNQNKTNNSYSQHSNNNTSTTEYKSDSNNKSNNKDSYSNNYSKTNFNQSKTKEHNTYSNINMHSKVVGVTYEGRQQYVKNCYKGQELRLVREPNNEYDKNAIAVFQEANQLGYIKKELAAQLSKNIDCGQVIKCTVEQVTGGNGYSYGLNIHLFTNTYSSGGSSYNYSNKRYKDLYDDDLDFEDEDYEEDYYNDLDYDYSSRTNDDYLESLYENDPCLADPDMCCGYDH